MQKFKSVEEFISSLDDVRRKQVNLIRDNILAADPLLREHIKWNAPSYVYDGEDRITFNLAYNSGAVRLVLHMGATRKEIKNGSPVMHDSTGMITWSSDSRGIISFESDEDIETRSALLKQVIAEWLAVPLTP